jgi:hypothetical protein
MCDQSHGRINGCDEAAFATICERKLDMVSVLERRRIPAEVRSWQRYAQKVGNTSSVPSNNFPMAVLFRGPSSSTPSVKSTARFNGIMQSKARIAKRGVAQIGNAIRLDQTPHQGIAVLKEKLSSAESLQSKSEMVWRGNGFADSKIDGKQSLISNYRRQIEEHEALLRDLPET